MGTNAIYFTPITDTQKVLTILVEVSFQKASIIKLIYTKYSIYERRKKGQARGHDIWFYLNKPLIFARIIVTFTRNINE